MKLQINTTPEQDAALAALNTLSNPGAEPPLDEFAISDLTSHLDVVVSERKARGLTDAQTKLRAVTEKLTAQDLAEITAIAEKYAS